MKWFSTWAVAAFAIGAALAVPPEAQAQQELTVAIPSNLNTLDPAKTKIGEEYIVNFLIFSGLTEIDREGNVQPDLAESWEASDDQKTWTFKLREDAKFHDGSDVDAGDVKTTIERIIDKETGSVARVNFEVIDGIEAVDEHTVRFNLKQPYSGLAEIMSDRQARIVPSDRIDSLATEPIGSGPFELEEFVPGDRVVLTRNEDYFVDGVPKLDRIVLRIMPESATQTAALETGEIDLLWNLPLEAVDQFEQNPDVEVDSIATATWDGVIMNAAQEPFDDVVVRKAVQAALDKQGLVQVALFGHGTPTHTMIPPSHRFYNDQLEIAGPDIEEAKRLLAEAGFADGFDVTLYVPSGRPTRERAGLGVREMLLPIGINVEIQRVPWDKFVNDIEGKAAFYVDGFYSRPTIDTSIYPWYHSQGSWNDVLWNYSNPEVDQVLDAARAAKSDEERAELYRTFQELVVETPAGVIPYVLNHVNAYRKNVRNFRSSPMMWLDLRETTVE